MMKQRILHYGLLGWLVLYSGPAMAGLIPPPRSYHKMNLFDMGYKDRVEKDGSLLIIANSRPYDGPGFGSDMALYRAAQLTKESGHRYFQVLKGHVGNGLASIGNGILVNSGERVKLTIRPSDSPDLPSDCAEKNKSDCATFEADAIIERIGPTLKWPETH